MGEEFLSSGFPQIEKKQLSKYQALLTQKKNEEEKVIEQGCVCLFELILHCTYVKWETSGLLSSVCIVQLLHCM